MKQINLGDGLHLPLDVVTQSVGVLAKRRAGKSYLSRRLAEQLLKAGQQVVIVDPKGDWWGIRSSSDGKAPGFPVVIVGGERGDVTLEASAGEVIAKLVVEERVSCLLDLSLFRKHEVATFMAIFLENLYRLKAHEAHRTPVMLIVDEADAVAPQRPQKGEERMLGAAEDIVRRGGQRGIGCTLITQRSAVLNKNVLTQVQVLIALRTIAPQDLDALNAWVEVHGTTEEKKTLMASLPSLETGVAWVWSPGWPTNDGIFQKIRVARIETYDSGATPKPGEKRQEPKNLADVDLGALQRQMAATIQRAKENDPRELKARIRHLEAEAKKKAPMVAAHDPAAIAKAVERSEGRIRAEWHKDRKDWFKFLHQIKRDASAAFARIDAELAQYPASGPVEPVVVAQVTDMRDKFFTGPAILHTPVKKLRPVSAESNGDLPHGERAILIAVAQYEGRVTRQQVTTITGYKRSTRDAYLQRLDQKSAVAFNGDRIGITEEGVKLLGDFEPLPVGEELVRYWLNRLPEGERRILECIVQSGRRELPRDEIGDKTGYKRSTRDAYLQRMQARMIVNDVGRGMIALAEELSA